MFRKPDRTSQSVEDIVRSITAGKAYELQKAAEKAFADLKLSVGDRIEFETEGVLYVQGLFMKLKRLSQRVLQ